MATRSTHRDLGLLALFRRGELPVIALHPPGAGVAVRKHQQVAREELLRRAVVLGKNQLPLNTKTSSSSFNRLR